MKAPENMDSTDLCPAGPSDDDVRQSVSRWLDAPPDHFDPAEFWQNYLGDGAYCYSAREDALGAVRSVANDSPHFVAECLREWTRDNP